MLLAAKLHDSHITIRGIVTLCNYVKKLKTREILERRANGDLAEVEVIDLDSFEFLDLKQEIVEAERIILKALGF